MEWVSTFRVTKFSGLGKVMDEFERDFQKLREEVRNAKDMLNQRQDLIKTLTQKSSESISKFSSLTMIALRGRIENKLSKCFEAL